MHESHIWRKRQIRTVQYVGTRAEVSFRLDVQLEYETVRVEVSILQALSQSLRRSATPSTAHRSECQSLTRVLLTTNVCHVRCLGSSRGPLNRVMPL